MQIPEALCTISICKRFSMFSSACAVYIIFYQISADQMSRANQNNAILSNLSICIDNNKSKNWISSSCFEIFSCSLTLFQLMIGCYCTFFILDSISRLGHDAFKLPWNTIECVTHILHCLIFHWIFKGMNKYQKAKKKLKRIMSVSFNV